MTTSFKHIHHESAKENNRQSGKKIPDFSEIRPGQSDNVVTALQDNLQREEIQRPHTNYTKLNTFEQGEFAFAERRFSLINYFDFTSGTDKINSSSDVAFLFRELSNEAVEHSFAVYVDKNKNYRVQWLSMGSPVGTIVEVNAMTYGAKVFDAEKIYFVHNHPSGSLSVSKSDSLVMDKLEKAFANFDIEVFGIIINLNSGKYCSFNSENETLYPSRMSGEDLNNYRPDILSFSKQAFLLPPSHLKNIYGPDDVAAYLSAMKYGAAEKGGYLMLNRRNQVVGNFFFNSNEHSSLLKDIVINTSLYNARSVILYDNCHDYKLNTFLEKELKNFEIDLLDHVTVPSTSRLVCENVQQVLNSPDGLEQLTQLSDNTEKIKETYEQYTKQQSEFSLEDTATFLEIIHSHINHKTMAKKQTQNLQEATHSEKLNNFEYLLEQLKYLGFKPDNAQQEKLKTALGQQDVFSLDYSKNHKVNGIDSKINYELHFNKAANTDIFYLNSFDARLTKKENNTNIEVNQSFFISNKPNTKNITALEAFNLLDGRFINKDMQNKEGEKANYWIALDFESPKKDNGNHTFKMYHENYGFNLEETISQYPVSIPAGNNMEQTLKNLQKGNRISIDLLQNNEIINVFVQTNPQMKGLDFYNEAGQKLFIKPVQELDKEPDIALERKGRSR